MLYTSWLQSCIYSSVIHIPATIITHSKMRIPITRTPPPTPPTIIQVNGKPPELGWAADKRRNREVVTSLPLHPANLLMIFTMGRLYWTLTCCRSGCDSRAQSGGKGEIAKRSEVGINQNTRWKGREKWGRGGRRGRNRCGEGEGRKEKKKGEGKEL